MMKRNVFIALFVWTFTIGTFSGVSAQTACNPTNPDKPYRNTGIEFNHGTCTEGNAGSCGCGSSNACSDGNSAHGGHVSTVPYRCGTIAHAGGVKHGNAYLTACGYLNLTGVQCNSAGKCGCDKYGNNCSTDYTSTSCSYTSYFEESNGATHAYQGDWQEDIGKQYGCKVPAKNSTCFANSPQKDADQTEKSAGQEIGGCGTGAYGSPNGCEQNICNDSAVNHTKQSCRKDRDGTFKCGGVAACGEDLCAKDYLTPGFWGTGTGNGFTTQNYGLKKQRYEICNLNTEKHADAIEVCTLENTTIEVTHKGAKAALACRCGQRDVCDFTNVQNDDLVGKPATLKVVKLELENMVLTRNAPPSLPISGHVNTLDRHRLKVQFDLADCYNNGSCSNNTPANQAKDILYTRLIEVCPVNLAANSWTLQTDNWCVIRRVDGNLAEIQKEFVIDFPGFAISQNSEGPWTIRYRAINDVCNRTIYDNTLKTTGASKSCSGGDSCLKEGAYSCYDGTFGGIQNVGNDPNGSGNYIKVNYCASNANTNLDSAITPTAYSNSRSNLYIDLLYTPKN